MFFFVYINLIIPLQKINTGIFSYILVKIYAFRRYFLPFIDDCISKEHIFTPLI